MSSYQVFLTPAAVAINKARQDHLASLNLDLSKKSVLEVGAGIGLHTPFFLNRGCTVTVTDANSDNVEEIKRRLPGVNAQTVDLDQTNSVRELGQFDIVYCYGLLYHLGSPEAALQQLAAVCDGQILLELIVNPDTGTTLELVTDPKGANQSISGAACRPTRSWILEKLKKYFGHGYITATQPQHGEFPTNWTNILSGNSRAVFVGSKVPLINDLLLTNVPLLQKTV